MRKTEPRTPQGSIEGQREHRKTKQKTPKKLQHANRKAEDTRRPQESWVLVVDYESTRPNKPVKNQTRKPYQKAGQPYL